MPLDPGGFDALDTICHDYVLARLDEVQARAGYNCTATNWCPKYVAYFGQLDLGCALPSIWAEVGLTYVSARLIRRSRGRLSVGVGVSVPPFQAAET